MDEKRKEDFWVAVLSGTAQVVAVSLFLAAVVAADYQLTTKILIGLLGLSVGCFFYLIFNLLGVLSEVRMYQRLTFISTELNRIDPEDKTSAWEKLAEDMHLGKPYRAFLEPREIVFNYTIIVFTVLFFVFVATALWLAFVFNY